MGRGVRATVVASLLLSALAAGKVAATSNSAPEPADAPEPARPRLAPVSLGSGAAAPTIRDRFDVAYASQSAAQRLDLHMPDRGEGPYPLVVWIHGGGWERGDRSFGRADPQQALVDAGYAVASVGYRLSREAVFPAQLVDVKAAVRYLRANADQLGLEPARIGVWGESAGGHLAALLGTSGGVEELDDPGLGNVGVSSRVQAVVDWFGPSSFATFDRQLAEVRCAKRIAAADSLESRLVGAAVSARPDLARVASPVTYVNGDHPPFLIEHGKDDCLVPWQQSEELARRLNASRASATLVLFDHADHGGREFTDAANLARIVAFLDAHLR